eukprot:NODE_464_length_7114_cov_0.303350.p2 type:complete len:336 gc:universal NODE_464_length_7114_cov_0.303350:3954-2947(-)
MLYFLILILSFSFLQNYKLKGLVNKMVKKIKKVPVHSNSVNVLNDIVGQIQQSEPLIQDREDLKRKLKGALQDYYNKMHNSILEEANNYLNPTNGATQDDIKLEIYKRLEILLSHGQNDIVKNTLNAIIGNLGLDETHLMKVKASINNKNPDLHRALFIIYPHAPVDTNSPDFRKNLAVRLRRKQEMPDKNTKEEIERRQTFKEFLSLYHQDHWKSKLSDHENNLIKTTFKNHQDAILGITDHNALQHITDIFHAAIVPKSDQEMRLIQDAKSGINVIEKLKGLNGYELKHTTAFLYHDGYFKHNLYLGAAIHGIGDNSGAIKTHLEKAKPNILK